MEKIKISITLIVTIVSISIMFGCAENGKSEVVAEILPFEKLCTVEKWKNVAFEGYISPTSVDCKGTKRRRSSTTSINECSVKVFSNPQETGKSVLVTINAQQGDSKFNEITVPSNNYKVEDFKVYDNEEKLIPIRSRTRITGTLRNTDECHLDAERLDVVN